MSFKQLQQEFDSYQRTRAAVLGGIEEQRKRDQPSEELLRDMQADLASLDRWFLNRLLFDVASSLDSLAFAYRGIYDLTLKRSGGASEQSGRQR